MIKAIAAVLLVVAITADAGEMSIVASWRSPSNATMGIDYYGGYLYHATPGQDIINITTTSGSFVASLPDPSRAYDIDRTAIEFWTANGTGSGITRLSTVGSYIRGVATPGSLGRGVTYGEGCLWYATYITAPVVYRLTANGSIMASFRLPGRSPGGLFWDASTLWYADAANPPPNGLIYHVTTTGSVIDSIAVPSTQPAGVTWQGQYLWYTDYKTHYVYQVRYSPVAVSPASLGRVKAMYR